MSHIVLVIAVVDAVTSGLRAVQEIEILFGASILLVADCVN